MEIKVLVRISIIELGLKVYSTRYAEHNTKTNVGKKGTGKMGTVKRAQVKWAQVEK